MDWTAPVIYSPYRGDPRLPTAGRPGQVLRDLTEDSRIEVYELRTPDKALPIE
jgi:hypothetical protein